MGTPIAHYVRYGEPRWLDMRFALDMPDGSMCHFVTRRNERKRKMTENKNELREISIEFAVMVSDICEEIKGCRSYVDQIIRSSSSIGANLFEGKYAQSRADFIHKLEISLKECSETGFWIELLYRKNKLSDEQYTFLNNTRGKIQRMLVASITTAKNNATNKE